MIGSLATELGVSALPVREAIRRLEAEGLVVFRPNAGAHVAPADPVVFDEEMTVLAVLEGYATGLAAPFLGEEDVARLAAITDAMEAAVERLDTLELGRLNQDFHGVIYERCPNAALVELLRDVARRLDAIRQDGLRPDPLPRHRVRRGAPGPDRADRRRRRAVRDRGGRTRAQARHGRELPRLAGRAPRLTGSPVVRRRRAGSRAGCARAARPRAAVLRR